MDQLRALWRRRRSAAVGVAKLNQIAIELRFEAVAAESSECLEHQVYAGEEEQGDASDG
jgi:hypothetical protein